MNPCASITCALLSCAIATAAGAAQPPKLAVMKLSAKGGASPDLAEMGEEYLATRIAQSNAYQVISRDDVVKLLEHAGQLELMGCDAEACVAEVGGALGVDLLLTGSVARIDDTAMVTLKLLDVDRAQVERRHMAEVAVVDGKTGEAVMQALRQACDQMFAVELAAAGVAVTAPADAGPRDGAGGGRLWTWIVGGGAVLGLAAGAGLLVLGNVEMLGAQALVDQSQSEQVRYQDFVEQRDRAGLEQLGGVVLLGAGALTLGGAAVLFFVEGE